MFMEATIKPLNSPQLLTAQQALDRLFRTVTSAAVKAELERWYAFGLTGAGQNLSLLTSGELAEFLDKIRDLSLAIYCYQSEVQKGGDHVS